MSVLWLQVLTMVASAIAISASVATIFINRSTRKILAKRDAALVEEFRKASS